MRACDGCFNRVLVVQEKANAKALLASIKPLSAVTTSSEQASTSQSLLSQDNNNNSTASANNEGQQQQQKKDLFGRARISSITGDSKGKGASNGNTATATESLAKTQGRGAETMGVLSDTRDKLVERGEKLNRLQDRTEDLANSASEFAKLAKQLNEQQKSRWF